MKYVYLIFISVLTITACSYVGTNNTGALSPIQAIEMSAASAPKALKNIFELQVKSSNNQQGLAFLNSEKDSLDQRNLVIALRPQAINQLIETLIFFKGRFFDFRMPGLRCRGPYIQVHRRLERHVPGG